MITVQTGDVLALVRRQERLKIFVGRPFAWRNVTPAAAEVCKLTVGDDLAVYADGELAIIKTLVAQLPPVREVRFFDM